MNLSIIIPMLNEAAQLPDLFAHLLPLQRAGCEIVFADGGSTDASPELARVAGYRVVTSERGRAYQMNAGAAAASGEVLLFLHADTRLPQGAPHHIAQALNGRNLHLNPLPEGEEAIALSPSGGKLDRGLAHCWGRFDVCITGRPFMLRVVARMMNWRSCLTGIATGDQAMFMRRYVFLRLQGFPEQPLMEDIELSKRLKKFSCPACIHHCVNTSGRRWEARGVWPTIFLMWRLRWAYWRGADAGELANLYR